TADDAATVARAARAAGRETRHHSGGRSRHESVPQRTEYLRGGSYRARWDAACGTGLAGTALAPVTTARRDDRLLVAGRSWTGGGGAVGYGYRWRRCRSAVP